LPEVVSIIRNNLMLLLFALFFLDLRLSSYLHPGLKRGCYTISFHSVIRIRNVPGCLQPLSLGLHVSQCTAPLWFSEIVRFYDKWLNNNISRIQKMPDENTAPSSWALELSLSLTRSYYLRVLIRPINFQPSPNRVTGLWRGLTSGFPKITEGW